MKSSKKKALIQTTEEYASHSTIHGIGYIFDKKFRWVERLFWLLVVLAFLGLAFNLVWNTWTQWREEQVVSSSLMMLLNMISII